MEIEIKSSISAKEKRNIINSLFNKGCISIYLLYNIYKNNDKNTYFFTKDYNFFATLSKKSKELHIFSYDNKYIFEFKNLIKKYGITFSYLSGENKTVNLLTSILPEISTKIIFSENYYFYSFKNNNENNKNLENLISTISDVSSLQFKIPIKKRDLINLIELQTGYMIEEMNYPDKILSKKFILTKLLKIYKEFKLFYLTKDSFPVAKCEWNAYTHNIFQIGGVFTLPSFRKKGYSTYLIGKMILYSFNNLDFSYATLFVRRENYKAINLYEKLGFKKENGMLKWIILKN